MESRVYSVGSLTEQLQVTLEANFPLVWVRGEITNLSMPPSGHIYFTLKDARAQLQCVWFARRQGAAGQTFDPLTGELYASPRPSPREYLCNGLELLCMGSVQVYAPRGQYQLVVEMAEAAGAGLLALEFERRKAQLAAQGYFEQHRKRPLPVEPRRVALVTSPRGAAIHDFWAIGQDRGLGSAVRLFPVLVQGPDAAEQIARAIEEINVQGWAQVIVLIRGGGSMEDLWAFNETVVADAIFASRIPVLAGIGHEVDMSLADMTADVRAATPSHAAQLLWRPRTELWQELDSAQIALDGHMRRRLEEYARAFGHWEGALRWLSPATRLDRMEKACAAAMARLRREGHIILHRQRQRLTVALDRCWRAPRIRHATALAGERLEHLLGRLPALARRGLKQRGDQLEAKMRALSAFNPRGPLDRGYAMLSAGGRIITSVQDVKAGEDMTAALGDGVLAVRVLAVSQQKGAGQGEKIY